MQNIYYNVITIFFFTSVVYHIIVYAGLLDNVNLWLHVDK